MAPAENSSNPTPGVVNPTAVQSSDAPSSTSVLPIKPWPRLPASERAGRRLRLLDGLLVLFVLLFAFLCALFFDSARNGDFFLHAATGRLIAHGQYQIGVDPFAFTTQGERVNHIWLFSLVGLDFFAFKTPGVYWVNHNWLFDLIVYLFYDGAAVGGTILIVLKALMIAALAEVMLRTARIPGRPLWVPAACVGLAILTLSPRVQLQPVCVSYFFLGLTLWLLHLPRQKRARAAETGMPPPQHPFLPYWLIPPLCLLWVNLDSWFFLGPVAVALFLLGETVQGWLAPARKGPRYWAPGEHLTLALVLVVSIAACLVNPHHVWAFTLPSLLGVSEAAATVRGDDSFQAMFLTPFESGYFQVTTGLSAAGIAFYPLAMLGVVSFAAAQWAGVWRWSRAMLWTAFFVLSLWHVSAIPFFAVAAAPITALNFLDMAAKFLGAAPRVEGRAGAWALGGRVLTLLAGIALLVVGWPGWLQAQPWENRRVAWTIAPDSALKQTVDQIAAWQKEGLIQPDDRWFNTTPVVLPYLAWYCPGHRAYIDNQRLPLYDDAAPDFMALRKSMSRQNGDAGSNDPTWRKVLHFHQVHFLIWYDGAPMSLRPSSPLPMLLGAQKELPLLYLNGRSAVFGWRDPTEKVTADRFANLEYNPDRAAFGQSASPAPAQFTESPPREWWSALWTPEPPRPPEADEAGVQWLRFATLQTIWHERNETKWTALWGDYKRAVQVDAAVACLGSGGTWGGACQTEATLRLLPLLRDKAPLPSFPPQPGEEMWYSRARQLFDFGPPAPLYLGIRAGRRALSVRSDDALTWQFLAQNYSSLVEQTREGDRLAHIAYVPNQASFPRILRRTQIAAALRRALDANPDLELAELMSMQLYGESGFLDLAADHAEEHLRIISKNRTVEAEIKAWTAQRDQLKKDIAERQTTYLLNGANKPVMEKVRAALELGLGKTALDELLKVDWESFDKNDPNRVYGGLKELSLLLLVGRVEEVRKTLMEQEASLKGALGVDPEVDLPAYDWLRVQTAAARGDYADADHWLEEIGKKARYSVPLIQTLPRLAILGEDMTTLPDPSTSSLAGLLVGRLLLRQAPTAAGVPWWLAVPQYDVPTILNMAPNDAIAESLGRQADVEAVRGWLALEAGQMADAREHFDAALQRAPANELPFRGRGLVELEQEWMDAGK